MRQRAYDYELVRCTNRECKHETTRVAKPHTLPCPYCGAQMQAFELCVGAPESGVVAHVVREPNDRELRELREDLERLQDAGLVQRLRDLRGRERWAEVSCS